ncbi:substrate-binding domain-containing protein [bacterium]|nr:substrate-binding domain-containing protein [bacterium]MBU1882765.1 substrate-binding domain-containing protein [bacterium]
MRKLLLSLLILFPVASMAETVKAYGCGITRDAFVLELNQAYEAKFGVKTERNTKGGVEKMLKLAGGAKVDVAGGCRPPLNIENDKNVKAVQVGWGALVFIVNPTNKVSDITIAQAKDVLTGKITNWKALGGDDAPIKLYLRSSETSGVGYSGRMLLFKNKDQALLASAKRENSSGPIRNTVQKDKDAFAMDDYFSSSKKDGLKILAVNGVKPSKDSVASGKYPLPRPFYIYTNETPTAAGKQYVDFALSAEGQAVISKAGTVNLAEGKNLTKPY